MIGNGGLKQTNLGGVMAKQETKAKLPPKMPSVQSAGFIGSGSNQITLSDATVKKIFKLAAVRAAAKK
jgi:hypothetical protein